MKTATATAAVAAPNISTTAPAPATAAARTCLCYSPCPCYCHCRYLDHGSYLRDVRMVARNCRVYHNPNNPSKKSLQCTPVVRERV